MLWAAVLRFVVESVCCGVLISGFARLIFGLRLTDIVALDFGDFVVLFEFVFAYGFVALLLLLVWFVLF